MINTANELMKIIHQNKEQLIAIGVQQIGFFGSIARGEITEKSDIDMMVVFQNEKKNFTNFMKLYDYLTEWTEHEVDLLTPELTSPYIKPYIEKEIVFETL